MKDIKKILVALAFSDHVQDLFNYAAGLAGFLNAEIVAANIISSRDVEAVRKITDMGYDVDGEHYVAGVQKERQQTLEEVIRKSGYPSEKVRYISKIGKPIDELLGIIVKEDIDLIVMGIKEHTELEHFLVGSVAEKLFRRSPVPVVSYRHAVQAERLKKRIHP
jgi:nucleotide-binding universal stress UspA family protein